MTRSLGYLKFEMLKIKAFRTEVINTRFQISLLRYQKMVHVHLARKCTVSSLQLDRDTSVHGYSSTRIYDTCTPLPSILYSLSLICENNWNLLILLLIITQKDKKYTQKMIPTAR